MFTKTSNKIRELKKIFIGENFTLSTMEDGCKSLSINPEHDKTSVTAKCLSAINMYLKKNKGAVSDFNLIKDIVERHSDSLENEIQSQTPLPLYLGLMGTVAGIILGLTTISDFSQIENVVTILMSDVAVAMIASFTGILFTTLSLWRSKQCKVIVEERKNSFYSFIQTCLLPSLSKSAVSTITTLERNLTQFNSSFSNTVERLDARLGDVGDLYESQIELLDKIEQIDVNRMAHANVRVLGSLEQAMPKLQSFADYMNHTTEYLNNVRELNLKIDEHLTRTGALNDIADFYKTQMKEISLRQDAIKEAVTSVDDIMKKALADLTFDSQQGLEAMRQTFVAQMDAMNQMIADNNAKLNQMPKLVEKLDDISLIPAKIDQLITSAEKSNQKLINKLAEAITSQKANVGNLTGGQTVLNFDRTPKWMKWVGLGAIIIIAISCIINLFPLRYWYWYYIY